MKIMRNNKAALFKILLIIVAFGGIFLIGSMKHNAYKRKILSNPVVTSGIISGVEYKGKSGYLVKYSFKVGNKFISSYINGGRLGRLRDVIKGKSFPVIFNGNYPEYNKMLIHPNDFKKYNAVFPDSLEWVRKYLE